MVVVVVVVPAPGLPLADKLILGPGLSGLTPGAPILLPLAVVLLLASVVTGEEGCSSLGCSSSVAGAAVVRPRVLKLKDGRALERDGRADVPEVLPLDDSSLGSSVAVVVRPRGLEAPKRPLFKDGWKQKQCYKFQLMKIIFYIL